MLCSLIILVLVSGWLSFVVSLVYFGCLILWYGDSGSVGLVVVMGYIVFGCE